MQQFCPWEPAKYLIFSSNVPHLLFYSHIPAMILALVVGLVVFFKTDKSRMGIAFLIVNLLFFSWCLSDLIIWATNRPDIVLFFWSLQILLEPLTYIIAFYFVHQFIKKVPMPFYVKSLLFILYIPIVALLPTNHALLGVDISTCNAVEAWISQYYTYIVELVSVMAIVTLFVVEIKKLADLSRRKEARIFLAGILFFLFSFSWGNIIGSFSDNWVLAQIGLIGMPIFMIFVAYTIVKFKTFDLKIFGAQFLVLSVIVLVASLLFVNVLSIIYIIIGVTLVLLIFAGYFLVKGVRLEIAQKERLQVLKDNLEDANIKLESLDKLKTEFLSLASHQLRSPLTAITGYTSMLLDGSFGKIDDKQKEAVDRVFQSSRHLTKVVEDLLNVSKIEQGGMQYVMTKFDFEKAAEDLAKDLSITAEKKGLKLTFETDKHSPYTINGDMEKIRQVILNFVDNSIKYTKTGTIKVLLSKVGDKIRLEIKDTGMGMTPEIKEKLFQKFSRGDGAKVNTGGSGLGLYLAKKIVEEGHKGTVGVDSEGPGKGSTFWMELTAA